MRTHERRPRRLATSAAISLVVVVAAVLVAMPVSSVAAIDPEGVML
jgi:hypothetical protein